MTTREKADWLLKNPMYQHDCSQQQAQFSDDIVEAWLEQHPSDDDEAVTTKWMDSIGFEWDNGDQCSSLRFRNADGDEGCICYYRDRRITIGTKGEPVLARSRGQVRLLLKALGIPTQPNQHEESGQ